jgi:hypothetical protein
MRKAFIATVQVVVLADSEGEACDGISETLRPLEERLGGNFLLDWRYTGEGASRNMAWTEIEVPEAADYEEGQIFIDQKS